jgi:DNA-binding transcriptional MerR regulator
MDKAPDAFRTISEVADDLQLPQHVLRFWETRFAQIKPMKRAGGRRYYRPDDVELLRGIHHLLYSEGYTIRGVQRILRDQGIKYVQTVWQGGAVLVERMPDDEEESEAAPTRAEAREAMPHAAASEARDALTREDLRTLQESLFELNECRRLLDAALQGH